jgi:hypothetical protein
MNSTPKKLMELFLRLTLKRHMIKFTHERFLQQTLRMKGFSHKWCRWIQNMVSGGSLGIKVNDDIGPYFQTKRGHLTLSLTC